MSRHTLLAATILVAAVPGLGMAQAQRPVSPAAKKRQALMEEDAKAKAETPLKSGEIMSQAPAKLVEILQNPEASEFAKAKACQRLAVVGDKTAVPALAALLADPKLAHYARFGLEPIPDASVDAALREALGKLDGKLLIGVINTIGRRKDPKALDALAKLMHGADSEVAEAARAALGRIRSP